MTHTAQPSAIAGDTTPDRTIPVSIIIMTRDEEANLEKCLQCLQRFSEVFVVDSHSQDRTREIAAAAGATVVPFDWDGRYPKKKQWCLDNLPFTNDWVLYVDADEEVTTALADEIAEVVAAPRHAGYFIGFDYVFMSRVLRHGRVVYKLVLLATHSARFPEFDDLDSENAGEVELHFQPEVSGSTATLAHRMVHNDFDTLFHFFDRHNRYSDWEAVVQSRPARRKGEVSARGLRLLKRLFDRLPGQPVLMFIYAYVVKQGYRDGRAGFDYALALAFYVWQIGLKRAEYRQRQIAGGS